MLEHERGIGHDNDAVSGVPTGLTENLTPEFLDFLKDVAKHDGWSRLKNEHPELEPYLYSYISTSTSYRDLSAATRTAMPEARQRVLDAVTTLHGYLPSEVQETHAIEKVLKIRKNGRARNARSLTIKPETNTKKPSINALSLALRKAADERLITERQQQAAARQRAEDLRAKRLRDEAYDMKPKERDENPVKGAKYNLILAQQSLPKELRDFFRDHPGVEVEDWKNVQARLFGGSYITFTRGDFVYIGPDMRVPLTPGYIDILSDIKTENADPENVRKFGRSTFKNVRTAIELCAVRNGYKFFKAS